MVSRLDLQRELIEFLGSDKVYFEPTESIQLSYPCIVYHLNSVYKKNADNQLYIYRPIYQIKYISPDPNSDEVGLDDEEPILESSVIERFLMAFPRANLVQNYVSDGLYHSVFELMY